MFEVTIVVLLKLTPTSSRKGIPSRLAFVYVTQGLVFLENRSQEDPLSSKSGDLKDFGRVERV